MVGGKKKKKSKRPQRIGMVQMSSAQKPPAETMVALTECAAKYAIAIADPWNSRALGACVPHPPARLSRKCTSFTRGIITIGSGGYGFIAVAPTIANDTASIYYSGATYAGNIIDASNAPFVGVIKATQPNIPYTADQVTTVDTNGVTAVRGRVVSSALSLKYIGTELTRGGRVMCYSSPDHSNINNFDAADLGARSESDFSTPSYEREKCWTVSYGILDNEWEYSDANNDVSFDEAYLERAFPLSKGQRLTGLTEDASSGAVIMGALITGVPSNTFEFEVVQHLEYVGALAESAMTESSADPAGLALVQSAAARTFREKKNSPDDSFKKCFRRELIRAGKEIGKAAIAKGGAMLLSALL